MDGQPLSDRLVIKEDTTVTAVFEKITPKEYTLTVKLAGTGTGAVIDSDTACEAEETNCLELFSFHAGAEEAPVQLGALIAATHAARPTPKARPSTCTPPQTKALNSKAGYCWKMARP